MCAGSMLWSRLQECPCAVCLGSCCQGWAGLGRGGLCQPGGTAWSSQPAPGAPCARGRRAWPLNPMATAQSHPREQGTSHHPVLGAARAAWRFQKLRVPEAEGLFFRRELSSDFPLAFSYYICSVRAVFRPFSVCSGRSPVISEWVWGEGNKYFVSNSNPKN